MNKIKHIIFTLIALFCIWVNPSAKAQIRLPHLISDGMVLQRNTETKIWGWSAPNEKITIQFLDKTYDITGDENGKWMLKLSSLSPGGPYDMILKASNTITIHNILIGDVWLCSGQSNMDLTMDRVSPLYQKEIDEAGNTNIRYFDVPQTYNFNETLEDVEYGNWQEATPQSVVNFSAVAYFFACHLFEKYKVPIGLLKSSLGGSPAQSWLSEDALKKFPSYLQEFRQFQDNAYVDSIKLSDEKRNNDWYASINHNDKGLHDNGKSWKSALMDDGDWKTMNIPGYWADTELGEMNGVVWFRKEINIEQSQLKSDAKIILGRIVDADSLFINGQYVGNTTYQYPPRRYNIPEGILKPGKNIISIRVINNIGNGGFVPDKDYELVLDNQKTDLKGEWKYKPGVEAEPLLPQTFIRWKAGGLYNAMIAPLINYAIKGAIWYQGEANTNNPQEYKDLMEALIADWRTHWNLGEFPFLFVQLANFMEAKKQPSESNWALLREQQLKTLEVPNTGMAVIIDLGEWNDIHPLHKKEVGNRLGLAADKIAYGEDVVYSGPIYKSMKIKKAKIIISFSNTGSGLTVKDSNSLKEFAIAGKDRKFIWAQAVIKGDKVIVWNDNIKKPAAVRYAWADNPEHANLFNKEGLPASPFRTDEK